jgi:hypothetical protein
MSAAAEVPHQKSKRNRIDASRKKSKRKDTVSGKINQKRRRWMGLTMSEKKAITKEVAKRYRIFKELFFIVL